MKKDVHVEIKELFCTILIRGTAQEQSSQTGFGFAFEVLLSLSYEDRRLRTLLQFYIVFCLCGVDSVASRGEKEVIKRNAITRE
ncbi:hypothetical protein L484_027153 [Morus notabilis]|uniref:Uncharacterized protein n=1 Tax=Morus notabilis TaxID=981085 RepID=W9S124_9ROSA|nr:hypothetical protein L484_027153 [Morus notabilis]